MTTDIYLYDLIANTERKIATNSSFPSISGDVVVWVDYRNGIRGKNWDLYGYDLVTNTELKIARETPNMEGFPVISDDKVVWEDYRNGNWDIYFSSPGFAPVFTPLGNRTVSEGQLLSFGASATDPDGETLTYSARGLPTGAAFNGQTFSWTPGFDQAGVYSVTFFVTDSGGLNDSETIAITVDNVNRPPVLNFIGNKSVNEGANLTFTVSAADPDGDALTYSASGLPAGATFSGQTFSWIPTSSQAGNNHYVTFTVSDGSLGDSETVVITVPVTLVPSQMTFPVPGGLTLSSSSVTFQWDFGMGVKRNYMAVGTTPPDPNSGPSSNIYWVEPMIGNSFTIPNIPLTGQPIYVRLYSSLYDGKTYTSEWHDYVYQTQVPNQAPVLNSIGNKFVNEGELLSFITTAIDADGGDVLTYSASNLPAGANFIGNIFTWTPDYIQAGSYSITFTVTDSDGLSDSETIGVTVDDVDRLPVLDPVGNRSVLEGQLLTFTLSATDPDGTPLTYTAPNLPAGATFSGQTFSWTPTYDQVGSYRVAFYVYSGGISDSESIWISVVYNTLPSQMISPMPGSTLNSLSVTFQWDSGIGVGANYMAVGTTPPDPNNGPSSDIYSLSPIVGNSFTIPNIPLTGQPIYVRLYSNLYDGVKGFSKWNDYIYQTTLPTDLSLTNQTINSGVVEHKALNSIIAGQAFVVEGAADVTFKAGAVITLKPGFRAMTGSKFRAVPNLN